MSTENTHFGKEYIAKALSSCKSVFFIGIGGINMSSLAHITAKRGYKVGGSDRAESRLTQNLEKQGISIFYTHSAENVKNYDAVVYTVAISPDNPEYVAARLAGKPCFSRADYLGYIMTDYKNRIGISGMHGKSTCTSMCAQALIECGASPTVLSGAELPIMGGAYTVGEGEHFVFEACEYMDSFLDFNPTVAVVLNIEMDHVDYFKSMEQIRSSYARFADITTEEGYAVYNLDDTEVVRALSAYKGNRMTFAIEDKGATLRAVNLKEEKGSYTFDVEKEGSYLCTVRLGVTGKHNVLNALAALCVCILCDQDPKIAAACIGNFCGAARRMEYKGRVNGCAVYDDYGHHPTEVAATLKGAKGLVSEGGRLYCLFQPHTYSRTKALLADFALALSVADKAVVAKIYPARETDTLGVSAKLLASKIKGAEAVETLNEAAELLKSELTEKDVVIIMGAGDIYKIFPLLDPKP